VPIPIAFALTRVGQCSPCFAERLPASPYRHAKTMGIASLHPSYILILHPVSADVLLRSKLDLLVAAQPRWDLRGED
jgi:hypothetical protein